MHRIGCNDKTSMLSWAACYRKAQLPITQRMQQKLGAPMPCAWLAVLSNSAHPHTHKRPAAHIPKQFLHKGDGHASTHAPPQPSAPRHGQRASIGAPPRLSALSQRAQCPTQQSCWTLRPANRLSMSAQPTPLVLRGGTVPGEVGGHAGPHGALKRVDPKTRAPARP